MAYILIRGSDQAKYGIFKNGLEPQFYFDNDQYTKTIVAAVYALNNHKSDMKKYERPKQNRDRIRTEQNETNSETSFAQKTRNNIICHCCGKIEHISIKCNLKFSPLRRTITLIRTWKNNNNMKMVESVKPLKKTVPPITLRRAVAVL